MLAPAPFLLHPYEPLPMPLAPFAPGMNLVWCCVVCLLIVIVIVVYIMFLFLPGLLGPDVGAQSQGHHFLILSTLPKLSLR